MATNINITIHYIGLSTDVKPVVNIPDGSIFFQVDDNKKFMFYDGVWYEVTF